MASRGQSGSKRMEAEPNDHFYIYRLCFTNRLLLSNWGKAGWNILGSVTHPPVLYYPTAPEHIAASATLLAAPQPRSIQTRSADTFRDVSRWPHLDTKLNRRCLTPCWVHDWVSSSSGVLWHVLHLPWQEIRFHGASSESFCTSR